MLTLLETLLVHLLNDFSAQVWRNLCLNSKVRTFFNRIQCHTRTYLAEWLYESLAKFLLGSIIYFFAYLTSRVNYICLCVSTRIVEYPICIRVHLEALRRMSSTLWYCFSRQTNSALSCVMTMLIWPLLGLFAIFQGIFEICI